MKRKIEFILRKVKKAYSKTLYPLTPSFKAIKGRIMRMPKELIGKYVLIIPITESEKEVLYKKRRGYTIIDDVLDNPRKMLDKITEAEKCEKKKK